MSINFAAQPQFTENSWLDGFQLHFGEWTKQIVDWTDQNLEWLIAIVRWPFQTLFDLLLNEDPSRTSIIDIPWYWVAISFFIIGSVARNTKIGLMAGVMVATCGLLGPDYWSETTSTFAMVFISVLLCTIIGIPLGILCGRSDAIWNVTRPTLDAMQVVHSFVYMLPFIFFWKVGEVSATMVTMVFALPPLVRLTNLGIRQVPEDVIEASRSFGATEKRVLTDVQLPLARPAIMTGLNQTLLLAISMLAIAALMGAGGLGKLLLRAISSQNLALAASGGLAFFLVAVVLDRISQREGNDGLNLLGRIREAWQYRKDPEGLLAAQGERNVSNDAAAIVDAAAAAQEAEAPAPVSSRERLGLLIAGAASVVAMISVLLPWGKDSGLISSWGRRSDETELIGQSATGIEASGGSIFAVFMLLLSAIAFAAALRPLVRLGDTPSRMLNRFQGVAFAVLGAGAFLVWLLNLFGAGSGPLPTLGLLLFAAAFIAIGLDTWVRATPRAGADGAVIAAIGAFGAALGYFTLRSSEFVESYSHGIGAMVAIAATALAAGGAILALTSAPYGPRRPIRLNVSWSMIAGGFLAVALIFVGSYSAWMFDERLDSLITPDMQAEIERLEAEAEGDMGKQIQNGQTITNMINLAQSQDAPMRTGLDSDGPGLGYPMIALGVLGAISSLFGAGLFGAGEQARWKGATITAGLGLANIVIPASWIFSFTRSGEPKAITGAGSFFALVGGVILFAAGRGVVNEFRRRKVYADMTSAGVQMVEESLDPSPEPQLSEALVRGGGAV